MLTSSGHSEVVTGLRRRHADRGVTVSDGSGDHRGIFWSAEYAEPILDRWQQWCRTAPERASTSMRLLNLPPLPGIPDQIAGRPVIWLDGAASVPQKSDLASGLRILDQMLPPLRAAAEPLLDTWAPKRPAELLLTPPGSAAAPDLPERPLSPGGSR
jgi:hypothetical protein